MITDEAIEAHRLEMERIYGGQYVVRRTEKHIYFIDVSKFIVKPSYEPLPYMANLEGRLDP